MTSFGRTAVGFHRGPLLRLPRKAGAPDPQNESEVREWVRSQKGRTAIDLFCGAGGLSLGLQRAGFTVLVGADSDNIALESHLANVGGVGYGECLSDPRKFLAQLYRWGISSVDLVAAGLPCQPFSRAGHSKIRSLVRLGGRDRDDPRTQMWRTFLSIVVALEPRAVLIENVPDLAIWQDGSLLADLRESLRGAGYRVEVRVLRAFDYGVPQHRQRLILVGVKRGIDFVWPTTAKARTSLKMAIGDLPVVRPAQRNEAVPYRGPLNSFQRSMRASIRGRARGLIFDHITRDVRPDDAEAFKMLRQGGTYSQLPSRLRRYRDDIFDDRYKRLAWNDLSRSITAHLAKDGYWYIHPTQTRTLSIREAARIQTFPDNFRFAGTPTHRYRQIGNAVPPMLAEAIGRSLHRALSSKPNFAKHQGHHDEFRRCLVRWYRRHGRKYPWRARGVGAWKVLLAEICLRRTRADQVVPVYRQLARLTPTPRALVDRAVEAREIMRTLGLHWRGENLVSIAHELVSRHRGRVPRSERELRELPGVGDYVARAVQTFAMGRSAAIIDTNTRRIVSRVRGRGTAHAWQYRLDLYDLAGSTGPDAVFNYALLDLGALVCTARRPLCKSCPVRDLCEFGKASQGAGT